MPTTDSIPMGEAISIGFNRFKEHIWLMLGVTLVTVALPGFVREVGEHFTNSWLIELATYVITLTLDIGMINIAVKIHNNAPVEFSNLFDVFPRVPFAVVSSLVAGIAVVFGLLLLLVPGLIVAVRLQFFNYWILEGYGPIESIQRSWEMTRGFTLDLFLLALLFLGIFILGIICLVVGTIVAVPVLTLAQAYIYLQLRERYLARYSPATAG